jgi:DNA-binding FadR family transcriptional regulator
MPKRANGTAEVATNVSGLAQNGATTKRAELVSEQIKLRIIEANWPVGKVLGSEADLLAEYGVSRAVFREAVRLLEHDHVARMRRGPGGGLVVTAPDPAAVVKAAAGLLRYRDVTPADLIETRVALETAAVRRVADNVTEEVVERLRDSLRHEATFTTESDATIHDFHVVVAELSGDPSLHLFIDVLTQLTAAGFMGSVALFDKGAARRRSHDHEIEDVHAAHEGIAEAIISGDAALAQYRNQKHLRALATALGS